MKNKLKLSPVLDGDTKEQKKQSAKFYPPMAPPFIEVTAEERVKIICAGRLLKERYSTYENPEFISTIHLHSYKMLPKRLAKILSRFGSDFSRDQYGAIVFRGLADIDQVALGITPSSWRETDFSKLIEFGFISALIHGAVPSKPVEYYAQRKGGGLLHPIIPEEKMENSQTGSGSKTDLYIHTEDTFLFNAADFLSFFYIRNEEQAPSMLYSVRSHGQDDKAMQKLFKPIYKCPKDANYSSEVAVGESPMTSILYGNDTNPFIRFDAAEQIFNKEADQTDEAMKYLIEFWDEAQKLIYKSFVPKAGDLVFVNNHLCAHGRSAFTAGFKSENGELVKCERRQMLRMMSKTSLISIRSVTHPENPYLIMEEHYGKIFAEEN